MNTPLIYCWETSEINFSSWDFSSGLSFLFHIERRRAWNSKVGSSAVKGWTLVFFLNSPKVKKNKILCRRRLHQTIISVGQTPTPSKVLGSFQFKLFFGGEWWFYAQFFKGETRAPRKIVWFNYQNKTKLRASVYKMRVQWRSDVHLPPTCSSCGRLQPS